MRAINILLLVVIFATSFYSVQAQCQLLDGNGVASGNPVWTGCSQVTSVNDTTFIINIFPANIFQKSPIP